MTDQELIELLQNELPEDLTEAQLIMLRARLRESPELREALVMELRLEGGLATTLAPAGSFEALLLRLEERTAQRAVPRWALLLAGGLLVVILAAGGAMIWHWAQRPAGPPQNPGVALNPPGNEGPIDVPATAPTEPDYWPDTRPSEDALTEAALASDNAPPLSRPDADWLLYLEPTNRWDLGWTSAVERLVRPSPPRDHASGWVIIKGNYTLQALPNEQRLLRLSTGPAKGRGYLDLWSGKVGVRLDIDRQHEMRGYILSRDATSKVNGGALPTMNLPRIYSDSAGRADSDARRQDLFDVRWQGGQVLVARGDVVLLAVPLAQPPTEGYFSGEIHLSLLQMVRCVPLPPELVSASSPPVTATAPAPPMTATAPAPKDGDSTSPAPGAGRTVVDSARPADLAWSIDPARTALLIKHAEDGTIELRGPARPQDPPASAWLSDKWPRASQIILHTPGLPVGGGISVQADSGATPLVFRVVEFNGQRVLVQEGASADEPRRRLAEGWIIGPDLWWRINLGTLATRVKVSHDGQNWAGFYAAEYTGMEIDTAKVGLTMSNSGGGSGPAGEAGGTSSGVRRGVRVDRVVVRRLDGIEQLADPAVTARLPAWPAALPNTPDAWSQLVESTRPADLPGAATPGAEWRVAWCAAVLRHPVRYEVRRWAEGELLRLGGRVCNDPQLLLRVLRELPYRLNMGEPPLGPAQVQAAYDAAARVAVEAGKPDLLPVLFHQWLGQERPYGQGWHAQVHVLPPGLTRRTAVALIEAHKWDELLTFGRHVQSACRYEARWLPFPREDLALIEFAQWAALYGWERLPTRPADSSLAALTGWSPLLAASADSEAASVLAEIRAAVDNRAFDHACRLLTQRDLPDQIAAVEGDPHRFRSVYVQIQEMIDGNPALRKTLDDQYAPLGALRLQQAAADGDVAALAAVTVQFAGTPAAATALEQLANRDLSLGNFYSAAARYARLLAGNHADDPTTLAAKRRLALALAGEAAGAPIQTPVRLNGTTLSPEAFEALITQIAGERRDPAAPESVGNPRNGGDDGSVMPLAPGPMDLSLFSLAPSRGLAAPPPESRAAAADLHRSRADVAFTVASDRLYVHRGGRITALWLPRGKELWSREFSPVGGPYIETGPGRPLLAGRNLFATMIVGRTTALLGINAADGKVLWRQTYDDAVLSDPIQVGPWLYVLTSRRVRGDTARLVLRRIRPATGESVMAAPLAEIRDLPRQLDAGRPVRAGDALVFRAAGAVLCVDLLGEVRWIRALSVVPADGELASGVDRRLSDLFVIGDTLIASTPRSPQVMAIDLGTGAEVWSHTAPLLRHVIGAAEGRVVITTDAQVEALDAATGRRVWQTELDGQPDAVLMAEGKTVFVLSAPSDPLSPRERAGVRASWLALATGQVVKTLPISAFVPGAAPGATPAAAPIPTAPGSAPITDPRALATDGRRIVGLGNFRFPTGDGQIILLEGSGK